MMLRLAVVSACAALALLRPQIAIAADDVALKFDWSNDVKAKVTLGQTIVIETDSKKHALEGTSTYMFEASPMADQLLVTTTDHRNVMRSYDGQPMNELEQWLPYSEQLLPLSQKTNRWAYLVSKEGAFIGLHDFIGAYCEHDAVQRLLREDDANEQDVIAECRKKEEQTEGGWKKYVQQDALNQAAQDWQRIVGPWIEIEMAESEIYESTTSLTTDESPDMIISVTNTVQLNGRFPCKQGAPDSNCVRVELVEILDTGSEPRPLMAVIDILLPPPVGEPRGPDFTKGTLRKRTEIHLVTDPATLLPHSVEEIETVSVTMTVYNLGEPSTTSTTAHRIWRYEYEQPN